MTGADLKIQAARAALWWRSRPGPVAGMIRGRGPTDAPEPREGRVRVAAVQVRATLSRTAVEFATRMELLVRQACLDGAEVVVFPEDNGTQLLGLLPGLEEMADGRCVEAAGMAVAEVIRLASPFIQRAFHTTFRELARAYRVWIVGGSIRLAAEDGRLVNVSYCYGPAGEIAGRQEKLHLMVQEEEWGFSPGRELTVVAGPRIGLAFPICHDATYFETFRLAAAAGAELVAIQAANPAEYKEWYARRGIWPRVQETPVYGIASHLVGSMLGMVFTGRSAICAPLALSPSGDGILAEASSHDAEEVIAADLDLSALADWRARHPLQLPVEVILRYLPACYEAGSSRNCAPAKDGDQGQKQRQKELAGQEHEEGPPPAQPVGEQESEVEIEERQAIQEEQEERQKTEGQEQGGQGEQVGGLGVPEDQHGGAEGSPAAGEPGDQGQ